ncbi:probable low affinity copper uptake protein 2 isoform X3 [Mercenaria mercenaria]|uniref:probable low affinity copper uptake protein 2 isoform X3 n=1 Tax=Mercenaria mercenaria TaxID=6596 RepID=UPI001E1D56CE|nr:probable low affinity copper uptake protein 2 isoform X3 [Mercenaria mercenaria]
MEAKPMSEYFYFSTTVKNFMFEDLSFHGSAGVVCVCLIIFSFTVLLEGTKSLIFYLRLRQNQNPLTYGKTETSIQTERSPLFSALMIPSSVSEIKQKRLKFHIGGYLLHSVDLLLGYLLMLAVMSYDAYILIAVILGSGVGYFVFGAINTRNQIKFQALQMSVYDRYDSQAGLTNSDASTNDASTNGSRYGSNGNTCDKTAR